MRQTKIVSMIDDGREVIFKIKQMPATKAERFTNRVLALLAGSAAGIDVKGLQRQLKSEKQEGGLQEIANLLTKLNYEKVEPLYNELIECVEHVPDSNNHNFTVPCTQESIDSIISDFRNLYKLRFEVLKLNYGFLTNAPECPEPEGRRHYHSETYKNVGALTGIVVSRQLATLYELQTVYSLEDLLDMYEIIVVNSINESRAYEESRKKNGHY